MYRDQGYQQLFDKAAKLIKESSYTVVFTGAGISTPSGIPDFRSPKSGLWETHDPFEVASIYSFNNQPEKFFNWIRPLAIQAESAEPNIAHKCLAKMEKDGLIKAVITQNIDDLHQKAGSINVYELHGNARTATCPHCQTKHDKDEYLHILMKEGGLPVCKTCGNIIKPDVVLFGEMLPQHIWTRAHQHCMNAEVMLIIGSSLEVSPANSLPDLSATNGAKLIINNLTQTHLDSRADIVLPLDVTNAVGGIYQSLLSM